MAQPRRGSIQPHTSIIYQQPQIILEMRQDDVAPAAMVMDTLAYYASKIAPDLTANQAWTYLFQFGVEDWLGFDQATRHLYICIVALHRAVQKGPAFLQCQRNAELSVEDMNIVHHHQACAARLLFQAIGAASSSRPDPLLLQGVQIFLSSQIQQGAYTPWRSHLNGAHSLLRLWGERACLGASDFIYFTLMTTNIFGSTTTPSHQLDQDIVSQHAFYLDVVDSLEVDSLNSLTPIPNTLIKAAAATNMLRAKAHLHKREGSPFSQDPAGNEILSRLRDFSCADWAKYATAQQATHLVDGYSSEQEEMVLKSWEMLVESFRAAIILYLAISMAGYHDSSQASWKSQRQAAYHALKYSIHWLFEGQLTGGAHHKFIVWPMAIAGVEAVHMADKQHLESLRHRLLGVSRDLGTLAMHDAAVFLAELWDHTHDKGPRDMPRMDWDVIFSQSPLFLM